MLIEKYRQIFNSYDKWRYYDVLDFIESPFNNETVADSFIYRYFQTGRKDSVFDSKFRHYKYRDVLEKINIESNNDNEIIITVLDNDLDYQNWFYKIIDLQNWLKVSVKQIVIV